MPTQYPSRFSLFSPPYRECTPVETGMILTNRGRRFRGCALIWSMHSALSPLDIDFAESRPPGMPLIVVLPRSEALGEVRERVFDAIERARPMGMFPFHPRLAPNELQEVLKAPPEQLAAELLDFFLWRGIYLDRDTRRTLRQMVRLSQTVTTLTALSKRIYLSRRALGRRFRKRGLPVPSHWLQFFRLLHASIRLQASSDALAVVARSLGYPDGFTLSNQMNRMVGVRPSTVRQHLGWEWLTEEWLRKEHESGGLRLKVRGMPSTPGPAQPSASRKRTYRPASRAQTSGE